MLRGFLNELSSIDIKMQKLKIYVAKYDSLSKAKFTRVLSSEEEQKISERLDGISELFRSASKRVRHKLAEIEKQSDEIKGLPEYSLEYSTRQAHWSKRTRDLYNIVNQFHKVQIGYSDGEKERMKMQIRVIRPELTDEQISEHISKGNVDDVLKEMIVDGPVSSKKHLLAVEGRNKKLKALAKKMQDTFDLISEVQEMVKRTGKSIDRIQLVTERAASSTRAAEEDLVSAQRMQSLYMRLKRLAILGIIGVIIVASVVIVVACLI